jgi:hypothetical protein
MPLRSGGQSGGLEELRKHLADSRGVRCPFFEEVMVAFCRAYPVKKMVPSDRTQANCICTGQYGECPLFREVIAKLEHARTATGDTGTPGGSGTGPPGE